jgi:hypothetical protein
MTILIIDGASFPPPPATVRVIATHIDHKNTADDDEYAYRNSGGKSNCNYNHFLKSELYSHSKAYPGSAVGNDGDGGKGNNADDNSPLLLAKLRDHNNQFVEYQRVAMMDAMRNATRRTSPMDAIHRRMEEGRLVRERREQTSLEREYANLIRGRMMPKGEEGTTMRRHCLPPKQWRIARTTWEGGMVCACCRGGGYPCWTY